MISLDVIYQRKKNYKLYILYINYLLNVVCVLKLEISD